jgi:hypothetical protein
MLWIRVFRSTLSAFSSIIESTLTMALLLVSFINLLSLFWKNERTLLQCPSSLCVCESTPINFECLNQYLWNLVCISRHLSPSQRRTSYIPPISLCVSPIFARQLLGKHVSAAEITCNSIRIIGHVYLWVFLFIPLSLLGNSSGKYVPVATKNGWRCRSV